MIAQREAQENAFQGMLEALRSKCAESDALDRLKMRFWERFLELGLPSVKDEAFQYIRLRSLYAQAFLGAPSFDADIETVRSLIYPECAGSYLVFANGRFCPELSNAPSIVAVPLSEAMKTYGTFLSNRWSKEAKAEKDPFAVLNGALSSQGALIYVAPNKSVESPLQILHLIDASETPAALFPRVQVFVGSGAHLKLVSSSHFLSGQGVLLNEVIDICLEEGAQADYYQTALNLPEDAWIFSALRGALKRDSRLKTVNVSTGSRSARFDYRVEMVGDNSEADLNGIWMVGDSCEAHTHVFVDHKRPNCRSNQLFKGVLRDSSRSSFEGKIYVCQEAQKTDAFQLNNNLLLGQRAQADSKPNLEIFADDVKASHGATVGQLNEDLLFYLKARGIPSQQAKNLLVHGYCREVIDRITVPSLVDLLAQETGTFLQ